MDVFQLMGKIAIDNSSAISAMDGTASMGEQTEGRLSSAFKKIGVAASAAFAVKKISDFGNEIVTSSAAAADTIDKMSQKIGVSRQAYQELDFIFSQSGASVDGLQTGMKTMVKAMESGSDAFSTLGISVKNSDGSLRSSEDVMWEAFSALQGMENQTEKAALATVLFGKSGTELMPLLNGAAGSIEEMKQKAHELGLVLGDEAVDAGVAYTDATDQLNRQVKTLKNSFGAALLPTLTKLINKFTPLMAKIMPKLESAFGNLVSGIEPVIDVISDGLVKAIDFFATFFEGVFGENGSINWDVFGDKISSMFKDLGAKIPDLLKTVGNVISSAWSNGIWPMIQGLFQAVFGIELPDWETVSTAISTWWAGVKEKANNIIQAVFGISGGELWENVKGIFTSWWNSVKTNVSNLFQAVWKLADGTLTWSDVEKIFTDWWDGIKEQANSVCKLLFGLGIGESIEKAREKIAKWWEGVKYNLTLTFGLGGGKMKDVDADGNADYVENDGGGSGSARGFANGIDFVSRDRMPSVLHYGEAVLNRTDAKAWRDGSGNGGMIELAGKMDAMLQVLESGFSNMGGQQIVLDSGVLVGSLSNGIDSRLGRLATYRSRRG